MNNNLKLFACCMVVIAAGFSQSGYSAMAASAARASEPVGKEDPFEMVVPIADAKKSIIQKIIGSGSQEMVVVEEAPELFIEAIMLKFLQATSMEPVVTSLTSSYGAVSTDAETNTLIIVDSRERLDMIVDQIRKADQTPRQIMVEVVIADVQLDDDTEIGVNWKNLFGTEHNVNFKQTMIADFDTTPAATKGVDFGFIRNSIDVTIHALQEVRKVEILSSPKVLLVSGQEGSIQTIEEIPYTQASDFSEGGTLTSTKFKEVGITLKVTATITDEGKILLVAELEQSVNTGRVGLAKEEVPIIDSRKAKSTLLMEDGQVAIIGGLRRKEIRLSQSKVPLLGDLPFIGLLFSSDKEEIQHSELVVFISPHIYDDGPLKPAMMKKFDELTEAEPLELETIERPEFKELAKWMGSFFE